MSIDSLGWPLYLPRYHAYIWGFTLINALFFVALANIHKLRPVADLRALQRLGKVSYGFYLFHCPIVRLTKYFMHDSLFGFGLYDTFCLLVSFGASWLAAELSFRFLEQPVMRLKSRFRRLAEPVGAADSMQVVPVTD